MGRSGYTSLSLQQDDYSRIRDKFDRSVDSDYTFTVWATSIIENSIDRIRLLKKIYPDYTLLKVAKDGAYIEDKKSGDVAKVSYQNKKFVCSQTKDKESLIIFAALHPEVIF